MDQFYKSKQLFQGSDLVESVNVSMTNFDDMMVDYPMAKDYAFDLFDKLHELSLLDDLQLSNYKKHVNNLANSE